MSEMRTEVSQGLGGAFARLFSLVTIFIGYKALATPGEMGVDADQSLLMGVGLLLLGIHGVLTNPARTNLLRKLLCYLSGVAGATVTVNIFMQLADL